MTGQTGSTGQIGPTGQTGPTGSPGVLVQTRSAEITTDTSTTSITFVTLLSVSLTTTGGKLYVSATVTFSNNTAAVINSFRIMLDSTQIRGASARNVTAAEPYGVALSTAITSVTAGAHTVALQWRVQSASTISIRPVSQVEREHATLLVYEVTG